MIEELQLRIKKPNCETRLELTKDYTSYRPAPVYTFSLSDDTVIEYRRLNNHTEPLKSRSGKVIGYGKYWGPWYPIKII